MTRSPHKPRNRVKRIDRPSPRPFSEMPDPMVPAEVAELLRCSPRHIYMLIRNDGLRCVRLGKSKQAPVLIYKEDYLEYVGEKRGKS